MAALFTLGLLIYYWLFLYGRSKNGAVLAKLLWVTYFCLGLSGLFVAITGIVEPLFPPNYVSLLVIFFAIVVSISAFSRFRIYKIQNLFISIKYRRDIENALILIQLYSIFFFLPFAIDSFIGDPNINRLMLSEKMAVMGSYGVLNSLAGTSAHLFTITLVFAFLRLAPDKIHGRDILRSIILFICSLSYVVYILAYVGRDGVVFWAMNFVMVFFIFRQYLSRRDKQLLYISSSFIFIFLSIPILLITISRFFKTGQNGGSSLFKYFGTQIQVFSDYSSIDRPLTYGVSNFPMFTNWICGLLGLDCPKWDAIRNDIFQVYLDQGIEPWLFGTFVSDLVADFGMIGALVIVIAFFLLIRITLTPGKSITITQLLLITFLYLIPYWGVFYFRFAISNSFIVVNLLFIIFVLLCQQGAYSKYSQIKYI